MGLIDAAREGRLHRVALEHAEDWLTTTVSRLAHPFGTPTLAEMLVGNGQLLEADDLVLTVSPSADLKRLHVEFEEGDTAPTPLRYGDTYAVGEKTTFLLYALVRCLQPAHVWETGVADGMSSRAILSAMHLNGHGTLHSNDIRDDVGVLVPDAIRDRWDLHILDRTRLKSSLATYAEHLPTLDLFVHDSRHTFAWQRMELALAAARLGPGSWIASDDVDMSYAFTDLCEARGLTPLLLLDGRKFFGMARYGL